MADLEADMALIGDYTFSPMTSPIHGLAFAIHRFKLDPIVSEIKLLFYHLPSRVSAYVWPSDQQSTQTIICQKLEEWRDGLDRIVVRDQDDEEDQTEHEKYRLKLTSQYYATMVLLHQPSQAIPQPTEQSILTCYECAARRLNTYNDLYQTDSFFQSWRSVQGIFSSGATMIYCLWTSYLVRHTISTSAAMRDLRTCTNLLSVGGELWPSVKKGKESFSRAMDALSRKLGQMYHETHQRYKSSNGPQLSSRRDRNESVAPQDVNAYHFSEGLGSNDYPQTASHGHDGPVVFPPTTFDMTDAEWTTFSNDTLAQDALNYPSTILGNMHDGPDAAVEAFIAEFMNNDTAWNPF
jgi:hypothetical protein